MLRFIFFAGECRCGFEFGQITIIIENIGVLGVSPVMGKTYDHLCCAHCARSLKKICFRVSEFFS